LILNIYIINVYEKSSNSAFYVCPILKIVPETGKTTCYGYVCFLF